MSLTTSNYSDSFTKISLYVLRLAEPSADFRIQAIFDGKLKYNFDAIANLSRLDVSSYYIIIFKIIMN